MWACPELPSAARSRPLWSLRTAPGRTSSSGSESGRCRLPRRWPRSVLGALDTRGWRCALCTSVLKLSLIPLRALGREGGECVIAKAKEPCDEDASKRARIGRFDAERKSTTANLPNFATKLLLFPRCASLPGFQGLVIWIGRELLDGRKVVPVSNRHVIFSTMIIILILINPCFYN